jgi:polysaccharide pyruvyl transferase WcaK-like protein
LPVVAVNYEPKVSNVFSDFDAPQYLIGMEAGMGERLVAATRQALDELPAYAARIQTCRARINAGASRIFDLMSELYPERALVRAPVRTADRKAG